MSSLIPPLESKYVKSKIATFRAAVKDASILADKESEITRHLQATENDPAFGLDPEFPSPLDWFNSHPLSFTKALCGKIVVLDFFTYCCINCMHILPDLEDLEQKYGPKEGVVVIGVHSAKFGNEKLSNNIQNAINRYGISHPVVNDGQIELWERLGITCWPTLVIIGPNHQLLHCIIGEGHGAELQLFMDVAVTYYKDKGQLSANDLPMKSTAVVANNVSSLSFPGKVCTDQGRGCLFIADSSHHRILAANLVTGKVIHIYGNGSPGLKDGVDVHSQFNTPQGMVCYNGFLYVADTSNHCLRKIDLDTHAVTTITGIGRQGKDKVGGAVGVDQEISSPWDLELGKSPDSTNSNLLFIAMAGTHQIWIYFLEDSKWTKGSQYPAGTTVRFSGSGDEANKNNSYPHKAAFAQPSGIATNEGGTALFIADSESSTVRYVSIPDGGAKALVGGAIDPTDLFAFGDSDGKGRDARLQHPLGVVWNKQDSLVYVCDSYNHKIKVVNPATRVCSTLAGTGTDGLTNGSFEHAQFSEPGGLCVGPEGKTLLVADTNNHMIRVLDLDTKQVSQLDLVFSQRPLSASFKRITGRRAIDVNLDPIKVPVEGTISLKICLTPPLNCHWTEDATSYWKLLPGSLLTFEPEDGQQTKGDLKTDIDIKLNTHFVLSDPTTESIQVEAASYFCEDSGVCHMQEALLSIPLVCDKSCDSHVIQVISYTFCV